MALIDKIKEVFAKNPALYSQMTRDDRAYKNFISQYPADKLEDLSLEDYCMGKDSKPENFSWWLERGLQPAMGRYFPGSARAHLLFKQKDGTYYKNRTFEGLSDEETLKYIMKVTKLIATAKSLEEAKQYDDDSVIYSTLKLEPRVTMGAARMLRVYCAYNPEKTVIINSPGHIAYFLKQFGYEDADIAPGPFGRAYQLWEEYKKIKKEIKDIAPGGFGGLLYSDDLGISPKGDASPESIEEDSTLDTVDLPKNLILYGPPGTGKTYRTVNRALEILDPSFYAQNKGHRQTLLNHFNKLKAENRIGFVTFHQSFSYEEFVEGLKAEADENGQVGYVIEEGIFKRMCESAASQVTKRSEKQIDVSGKIIWKMSLGEVGSDEAHVYQDCIENNIVLLGYGGDIDFTSCKSRQEVFQEYHKHEPNLTSTDYAITAVHNFKNVMKDGDLVIISDGNRKFRAIGLITGKYQFQPREDINDFCQARSVDWLRVYSPSRPREELLDKNFSQMCIYKPSSDSINLGKLQNLLNEESATKGTSAIGDAVEKYTIIKNSNEVLELRKPNGSKLPLAWSFLNELTDLVRSKKVTVKDIADKNVFEKTTTDLEKYIVNGYYNILAPLVERILSGELKEGVTKQAENKARVLIIDEINRGNIAKIFGELITLIEENKRAGETEAISVTLPYSKEPFSVPNNLFLIGTMNTADRSLTSIDAALRRRFKFEEVMPDTSLLNDIQIEGINVAKMLQTLNYRIESLLGREYVIGHSYFLPLKNDPSLGKLEKVFSREIIPLLKEYFFDDWEKIHRVLGDHQKPRNQQMVRLRFDDDKVAQLIGEDWKESIGTSWEINEDALSEPDLYKGMYEKVQKIHEVKTA